MSNKSCPFLFRELLYKNEQDFLDIQYSRLSPNSALVMLDSKVSDLQKKLNKLRKGREEHYDALFLWKTLYELVCSSLIHDCNRFIQFWFIIQQKSLAQKFYP